MQEKALAYLAEGKSFHDTAVALGVEPKVVIAIYAAHRANPK